MTTIYITRYALTEGIRVTDMELKEESGRQAAWTGYQHHYIGKDAFLTEAEAITDANARREKKIKSIQKQIDKLKKLEFKAWTEKLFVDI